MYLQYIYIHIYIVHTFSMQKCTNRAQAALQVQRENIRKGKVYSHFVWLFFIHYIFTSATCIRFSNTSFFNVFLYNTERTCQKQTIKKQEEKTKLKKKTKLNQIYNKFSVRLYLTLFCFTYLFNIFVYFYFHFLVIL